MGWMNCMNCGCQVHTSKLPVNACDDCEVLVNEIHNQSTSLPETKEDITWKPHACSDCGCITHRLEGDETEGGCVKCSNEDLPEMTITSTTPFSGQVCLQDTVNTKDPRTLAKIKSECAAAGCNVCLAETEFDDIEWPKHYNQGKIQPIDAIESWNLDFRLANVVKYIARAGKKDPHKTKQDLEKALWYIRRFIDKEL